MPGYTPSFLAAALLPLALAVTACGSEMNRQLESISITPASATGATASYTATGTFNTPPATVTPLPVSWFLMGPAIDPPGPGYTLVNEAFTTNRCSQAQVNAALNYTVIAVAPVDPGAPASGPMPSQVFEDLVITHSKTAEGGFVAATAALTCP